VRGWRFGTFQLLANTISVVADKRKENILCNGVTNGPTDRFCCVNRVWMTFIRPFTDHLPTSFLELKWTDLRLKLIGSLKGGLHRNDIPRFCCDKPGGPLSQESWQMVAHHVPSRKDWRQIRSGSPSSRLYKLLAWSLRWSAQEASISGARRNVLQCRAKTLVSFAKFDFKQCSNLWGLENQSVDFVRNAKIPIKQLMGVDDVEEVFFSDAEQLIFA
jgi:hypothetical protein